MTKAQISRSFQNRSLKAKKHVSPKIDSTSILKTHIFGATETRMILVFIDALIVDFHGAGRDDFPRFREQITRRDPPTIFQILTEIKEQVSGLFKITKRGHQHERLNSAGLILIDGSGLFAQAGLR